MHYDDRKNLSYRFLHERKQVSVSLRCETIRRLDALSADTGLSRSQIVSLMVEAALPVAQLNQQKNTEL